MVIQLQVHHDLRLSPGGGVVVVFVVIVVVVVVVVAVAVAVVAVVVAVAVVAVVVVARPAPDVGVRSTACHGHHRLVGDRAIPGGQGGTWVPHPTDLG